MIDTANFEIQSGAFQNPTEKEHEELHTVPSCQIHVNPTDPNLHDQLAHVVQLLCPFFDQSKGTENKYLSKPLAGGLSNQLFLVSKGSQAVLVRIHPNDKSIVNHDDEFKILAWLSQHGDAPGLYGQFLNGRIEEFLHGFLPLSHSDMGTYTSQIAFHMAELHSKHIPTGVLSPTAESIWDRIDTWFDMAMEQEGSSCTTELAIMLEQWKWVREELANPSSSDPIIAFCRQPVFCHMDLQSLNILKNPTLDGIRIIDYEYAGIHPRAVDISNTWLEYCDMNNLKADYEAEYPSEEQQNIFLRVYLSRTKPVWWEDDHDEDILQRLRTEIGKHTLVSHIGWAIWGVIQARLSTISFDYIKYSRHRMEGYRFFLAKFFQDGSNS